MACYQNYIGLRACPGEEPISGLYINDYPGMSTELLDKIASDDQVSYAGVWASVQRQAYTKLKSDVQKALREQAGARLDQVIFRTTKPFVQQWQSIQPLAPGAEFRGVLATSSGSKYLGLRVNKIMIYNAGETAVEDVDIRIIQTQDNKILYQNTENTLNPGMNFIAVNEVFSSDFDKINIALLVDCTELTTIQNMFVDYGWNAFDIECATRFSFWNAQQATLYPVVADLDYGLQQWTYSGVQNGIYWEADLLCSIDLFICEEFSYLTDAWARLLCSEILRFKLATNRVNYFSQSKTELTERNMATFKDEYVESMNTWAQQLNLSREGFCFNCEDSVPIKAVNRMP
ncbi:MAG: hypothetical protein BWZ05_02063 [Bacteroidetes bacterium ADurb.BinA245]|nr:MAG: hypothetical protein BWZ05_02063 [Bacteroidetes bacterium ADurb.BinA245]